MDPASKKILIADDEQDILELLSFKLSREGYQVITAANGDEALARAKAERPDLILLDVMMPRKSGVEVCDRLREDPSFRDTLIVFLTALADDAAQVNGLETGADDYLTKPVSPKVLVSKVNALFRRMGRDGAHPLRFERLEIDPVRFAAAVDGQEIHLAKKEFELLHLLASRPGRVFLRQEILDQVWGQEVIVGDRTIDVHVRKLRQKLGLDCIRTIKGVGYKFQP